jgi:hypothetical protein
MGGDCGRSRHSRGYLRSCMGSMTGAAELSLEVSRCSPARLECGRTRCCEPANRLLLLRARVRPGVGGVVVASCGIVYAMSWRPPKRIVEYVLDVRAAGAGRWNLRCAAIVSETWW